MADKNAPADIKNDIPLLINNAVGNQVGAWPGGEYISISICINSLSMYVLRKGSSFSPRVT